MSKGLKISDFPLLDDLFAGNGTGYQRIAAGDPHGIERRRAEDLLRRCAESGRVQGTEKLSRDGHASAEKFVSLLAELKFALVFAAVGAQVELLRDGAFEPALYTPDLLVKFPDGFELLVDAVRIAGGCAPLADALRSALEAQHLPYKVEQCAGLRLSIPAFDWQTHTAAKELCGKVAAKVTDALGAVAPGACGVVRVFDSRSDLLVDVALGIKARENLYDDVTGNAGPEWLGSFGFAPSLNASAGSGLTSAHFIDEETLGAKFVERVVLKATKRAALPPERANTPFIVALESNEPELRPLTVASTLTGPRCFTRTPTRAPIVPRFEQACTAGWERVLKEWQYVGITQMRFPNYGAFGDESVAWAKEVSGVMVLHDSDTLLQWLPNPFATDANARLLDIGFAFDMLGASSPHLAD